MTNKIIGIVVAALLIGGGVYYFTMDKDTNMPQEQVQNTNEQVVQPPPPPPPPAVAQSQVVVFETTEGNFEVTLDAKAAPKTVENFIKLVNEGFYADTKFHRIVQGFMVQGGDPNSKDDDPENDGQGGPGYTIPAEIGLTHKVGAIATARTGDQVNPTKASSGSQFYIVLEENFSTKALDGNYTVFGYVTSGMSVVTKIGATPTEPNPFTGEVSLPLKEVIVNKITIKE